jgi:hypothetical protein
MPKNLKKLYFISSFISREKTNAMLCSLLALLLGAACVLALSTELRASEDSDTSTLHVNNMRLAIWPEYDTLGMLVTYDGRFTELSKDSTVTLFPTKAEFIIPADAEISDVCSLSPRGVHFCQLYKSTQSKLGQIIKLTLPYPSFYLSFHTPDIKANNADGKKTITYNFISPYKTARLTINIKEPLESSSFNVGINRAAPSTQNKKDGFMEYEFIIKNLEKNEELTIAISYERKSQRPSVEAK